tara:strand:+ start:9162 stop:9719 length:558 start_codon:yes stop_codon:yes gene_type:complete
MEGNGGQTTPLRQLPQNSDGDTDLVNKILDQLDDAPTEKSPPTFEEPLDEPVEVVKAEPVHRKKPKRESHKPKKVMIKPSTVEREIIYEREVNPLTNDAMPSPKGIGNLLNTLDMDYLYLTGKVALFATILFVLFISYGNNLIPIFSKLPITVVDLSGRLNKTGIFLQALCYGLMFFLTNIFLIK